MSLLPEFFRRGDRMRPLGAALLPPQLKPLAAPAPRADWACATQSDNAPKQVRLHLTDDAQAEADDFHAIGYHQRGCDCFTGSAPCGWCTHPGNPRNLEENDDAWVMGFEEVQHHA